MGHVQTKRSFRSRPTPQSAEESHGRFTFRDDDDDKTETCFIWVNEKSKNRFWYCCYEKDIDDLSALKIEGGKLYYCHSNSVDWYEWDDVNDDLGGPSVIEKLRRIRSDYDAEKVLLLE